MNYKHGSARKDKATPTYRTWKEMLRRGRGTSSFPEYYIGISVCDRWQSFVTFLADMGERPEGKRIDRINKAGNYEPGNCRWASRVEQMRNRRNSLNLTINGETKCLAEWAQERGLPYERVRARIKAGIAPADALTPGLCSTEQRAAAARAAWARRRECEV